MSHERRREDAAPAVGAEDSPRGTVGPVQPPANAALRNGHGLVAACRKLTALAGTSNLLETMPAVAMNVCAARGAQLLEVSPEGATKVVSAHGLRFETEPERIRLHARSTAEGLSTIDGHLQALDEHAAGGGGDPIAVVSVPAAAGRRLLLALEREAGTTFQPHEVRELAIFAFLASSVLARAHSDAEVRASHAIQTALLSAVNDSVMSLDANGIVRALSGPAAALIGRGRNELIGKALREIPGLTPLSLAVAAGDRGPETVRLPAGEVKLHVRRCEAGVAVTLFAVRGSAPRIGEAHFGIGDLLGDSPLIVRARETAQRVADSHLPILITGETGTGKEILAQSIHNASARSGEPFIGVNVSAIPRELLESELFGYDAGAFTGASSQGRQGKFELARNGTLLLDEIGDMPLEMQAKLLRVLQERVVHRLGGSRGKAFSARLIASTNRDLESEVANGRFRLDLLHRLRVVHVELPPLRERGNDVRLLVSHRLRVLAQRTERAVIRLTGDVMSALETYEWPGNVRELVNALDSAVSLLAPGKDIIDVVPQCIERHLRQAGASAGMANPMTLEAAEREACVRALHKTGGNVARAARILGVVKATLYAKIRRYGIPHLSTDPGVSQSTEPGLPRQRALADRDR
ncbi:MAG: sigma-54 interaction domain-containing protein [Myxococcales bacterium]